MLWVATTKTVNRGLRRALRNDLRHRPHIQRGSRLRLRGTVDKVETLLTPKVLMRARMSLVAAGTGCTAA